MQLDPEPGAGAVPNSLYDVCVCKVGHRETQCQNANFAQDARFSKRGNGFHSRVSCDYGLQTEILRGKHAFLSFILVIQQFYCCFVCISKT